MNKPKGLQISYRFIDGQQLNLFGVTDVNVTGTWYRVTDHEGSLFIIDPAKVLWQVQKQID